MGEYAEEAFYLGVDQMDQDIELYGCAVPYDPKYDNEVWRGVDGNLRKIADMDSMHLCFVLKQLENSKGKIREHMAPIIRQLKWRIHKGQFSKADFDFSLEGVRLGLYCFYPKEADTHLLENYYMDMLKRYKYFFPPRRIFD